MQASEPAAEVADLQVDLVEHEYLSALQAANRRLQARPRSWPRILFDLFLWMAIGGGLFFALGKGELATLLPWLIFAGIGALLLVVLAQRKRLYRRLLAAQPPAYRLRLEADGVRVQSERGESLFRWSALEGIERCAGGALLHLKGYQVLWLPERCFADPAAFADFLERLRSASGLAVLARPEPAPLPEISAGWPRDLRDNLRSGWRFLLLRRDATDFLRAGTEQFVLLSSLILLASVLIDRLQVDGPAQFQWSALPAVLCGSLLMLLAAWGASRAETPARSRLLPAAVALAALWLLVGLLAGGLDLLPERQFSAYATAGFLLRLALLLWGALASMVALVRVLGLLPESRLAAVLAVIYLLIAPSLLINDSRTLWIGGDDGDEAAASRERWQAATREEVLYAQPRLLEEALARVKAGKPGVPELFFLGVAGYGEQDVFQREVLAVGKHFDTRFQTAGRGVLLINNPASVLERPVASVTAMRRALKAIGQRMNPEDVLFLFMTSHGSEKHRFDLSLWPYRFDDLTPQGLRQMLDEAGIRYRVVVVSACYSGGFVQPLSNPDTLVITAARADRNSHGCSHEAEWTFFGKAYFVEALAQTTSFTEAFMLAREKVAEREKAEGLEASEPQMAVGERIAAALKRFERR